MQGRLAHEPPDAVVATAFSALAQIGPHAPPAADPATARKARPDEPSQLGIALPSWPLGLATVRVKSARATSSVFG
jgi:hypothetical protein